MLNRIVLFHFPRKVNKSVGRRVHTAAGATVRVAASRRGGALARWWTAKVILLRTATAEHRSNRNLMRESMVILIKRSTWNQNSAHAQSNSYNAKISRNQNQNEKENNNKSRNRIRTENWQGTELFEREREEREEERGMISLFSSLFLSLSSFSLSLYV